MMGTFWSTQHQIHELVFPSFDKSCPVKNGNMHVIPRKVCASIFTSLFYFRHVAISSPSPMLLLVVDLE